MSTASFLTKAKLSHFFTTAEVKALKKRAKALGVHPGKLARPLIARSLTMQTDSAPKVIEGVFVAGER